MAGECVMFMSTVMVRRSCVEQVGFFDPQLPIEDWDWYLRAVLITEIATIAEPLVRYRLHANNVRPRSQRLPGSDGSEAVTLLATCRRLLGSGRRATSTCRRQPLITSPAHSPSAAI
jgi:hypothetical protein